jgi:hypothetical protein
MPCRRIAHPMAANLVDPLRRSPELSMLLCPWPGPASRPIPQICLRYPCACRVTGQHKCPAAWLEPPQGRVGCTRVRHVSDFPSLLRSAVWHLVSYDVYGAPLLDTGERYYQWVSIHLLGSCYSLGAQHSNLEIPTSKGTALLSVLRYDLDLNSPACH